MPLFEATLVNNDDKYDQLLLPIKEMTVKIFSTDIDSAEMSLAKLCMNVFPDLTIDSVYELGYSGSDPTVTESHNKRS